MKFSAPRFQPSLIVLAAFAITGGAHAQGLRLWGEPGGHAARSNAAAPIAAWGGISSNAAVTLPLPRGGALRGAARRVAQTRDKTEISGTLDDDTTGRFFASSSPTKGLRGMVVMPARNRAYRLTGTTENPTVEELPISNVMCIGMPLPSAAAAANTAPQSAAAVVPILNSRPNATAVLYLDFDGEIVNDSDWSDTPIVAEPARLTSTQIKETWARVKEDYLPFNINITTDVTRYYAAPIGHRMRCIVTPTNKWLKSSSVGGIALLGSFSDGGSFYSSTVPCWAFATSDPKDCAEVIAHEAGHTFGLSHDGTTSEEYYEGHGNGPLGWAPIMGAGYYEGITQWSKGEYPFANNTENDLAIISSGTNGFGYAASDAASSIATATQIFPTNGRFSQDAFIGKTGEIDFYKIDVESPGPFAVTATPVVPGGNMAAYVKLYRSDGSIVAGSPFSSTPAASVTTDISPGIYYVSVQGTGKTASGSDFGFTNYGSIGGYHLDAGTPIITFQPDIVAGKNPTAGRDHYGNEVQRLVVKVRNTKSIHVPISITNVGANSDSFHLRAGNLIGYKFRVILRSRDITTAIRHSGYFSEAIAASASLNMTLIIHPSKPVRTKSRLKLDAISIGDGSKSDTIIIELQPKK